MAIKLIPLSGKRGKGQYAIVDEEDFEKVAHIRWHLSDMGYAVNRSDHHTLRMHRLVNNTPEGFVTDHKNGNKLDNRKRNLRSITQAENARNHHGAKGYTWDESKGKWMVRYRNQFYGRYETEAEAQKAFRLARSGVPYAKSRRKYWNLPSGISKQFGKYRVRPQQNGERHWLGQFSTIDQAVEALSKWREQRG